MWHAQDLFDRLVTGGRGRAAGAWCAPGDSRSRSQQPCTGAGSMPPTPGKPVQVGSRPGTQGCLKHAGRGEGPVGRRGEGPVGSLSQHRQLGPRVHACSGLCPASAQLLPPGLGLMAPHRALHPPLPQRPLTPLQTGPVVHCSPHQSGGYQDAAWSTQGCLAGWGPGSCSRVPRPQLAQASRMGSRWAGPDRPSSQAAVGLSDRACWEHALFHPVEAEPWLPCRTSRRWEVWGRSCWC